MYIIINILLRSWSVLILLLWLILRVGNLTDAPASTDALLQPIEDVGEPTENVIYITQNDDVEESQQMPLLRSLLDVQETIIYW